MTNKQTKPLIQTLGVMAFLCLATLLFYWHTGSNEFVEYDDNAYLFENPHVISGLKAENIRWAFTTLEQANWHPVTWISHMVDVQLYGMSARGHHFTSLFLHILNTVILFLLFRRLTGSLWKSAIVAALFALHPLHVESVAWASERKDVLSTLFGFLTLYIYCLYAEGRKIPIYYLLSLLCFTMGLMAKPMLVSVPFLMLILDYWPLQRLSNGNNVATEREPKRSIGYLLKEKIPFLLLVAASCSITIYAQYVGNAMTSFEFTPLSFRIKNAAVSCVDYFLKTVWPTDMAVFYPYPESIPTWRFIVSAAVILAITILVFRERKRRPYLAMGWLWFICSIFPVIGIIKVGLQAMADRYTYIPLIGIFVMFVWLADDLFSNNARQRIVIACLAAAILVAFGIVTAKQVSHWRNSTTLFTHALVATGENFIAEEFIGYELEKAGKYEEALVRYKEAIRIAPLDDFAKIRQAGIYKHFGKLDEAVSVFMDVIRTNPRSAYGHINLGIALALQNKLDEAITHFETALKLNPDSATGHYNLGMTLDKLGRLDEAVLHFRVAIKLEPDGYEYYNNLGVVLAKQGKTEEAIEKFTAALQIKPDFPDAKTNLNIVSGK